MNFRVTLWFAVLIASSISLSTSLGSESCNRFVDDVLNKMKEEKDFFQEPYEIPESERSFGLYEAEFGHIYGLSTLHRIDDAIPKKKGSPYLKVYLGAGELKIKSKVQRKFLTFGKFANVDAKIPLVTMELDLVSETNGSNPTIKSIKIDEVKGLDIKVSGSGLIKDFFLNAFMQTFGRFFQKGVKTAIEVRLKTFLKDEVHEFTIPADCLNDV